MTPIRRTLLALLLAVPIVAAGARRPPTYQVGRIETRLGEILFVLYDETPRHKASFIKLASGHYWDSLTFNRVIKNFVAQGGCPDTPQGFGGSPYLLAPEFNDHLKHVYGAVGAGRDDNPRQLSAGCQFYIVTNKAGLGRAPRQPLHGVRPGFQRYGRGRENRASVPTDSTNKPFTADPAAPIGDVITMTGDQLKADGYVASDAR